MKINVLVLLIISIGALLIGHSVGKSGQDTDLEAYREQVEQFVERLDSVTMYVDSLETVNERSQLELDSITALRSEAQARSDRIAARNVQLQVRVDSLFEVVQDIPVNDVPVPVREYIGALELTVDNLNDQVVVITEQVLFADSTALLWRGVADNRLLQIDSLLTVVNSFPTDVPDNEHLLGFIPLPSRTASFAVGAVTAAVLLLTVGN